MKKMYMVTYCGGEYEDSYKHIIFVTNKKSKATKYVTKFNKILKSYKEYYEQFEDKSTYLNWIKDEYLDTKYERWSKLKNITECYWTEIELR